MLRKGKRPHLTAIYLSGSSTASFRSLLDAGTPRTAVRIHAFTAEESGDCRDYQYCYLLRVSSPFIAFIQSDERARVHLLET